MNQRKSNEPMPRGGKRPGAGRKAGSPNKVLHERRIEIKALAREHTTEAIAELARLATKADSEAARVAAIKELLDRGYGRSTQAMQVELGSLGEFSRMSDEELDAFLADDELLEAGRLNGKARN